MHGTADLRFPLRENTCTPLVRICTFVLGKPSALSTCPAYHNAFHFFLCSVCTLTGHVHRTILDGFPFETDTCAHQSFFVYVFSTFLTRIMNTRNPFVISLFLGTLVFPGRGGARSPGATPRHKVFNTLNNTWLLLFLSTKGKTRKHGPPPIFPLPKY